MLHNLEQLTASSPGERARLDQLLDAIVHLALKKLRGIETDRADRIIVDSERHVVREVQHYGYLPVVVTDGGHEFYVAQSGDSAGEAARQYWQDLAQDDSREFACLIGTETLVAWSMGHFAGPGTTHVTSLEDWLDLWLATPEEQWASYDGVERTVERCGRLADELGFMPTVAYRRN